MVTLVNLQPRILPSTSRTESNLCARSLHLYNCIRRPEQESVLIAANDGQVSALCLYLICLLPLNRCYTFYHKINYVPHFQSFPSLLPLLLLPGQLSLSSLGGR